MNIEQGISNHEVGPWNSSLLNWTFYIRYSTVLLSTFAQIVEKLHINGQSSSEMIRQPLRGNPVMGRQIGNGKCNLRLLGVRIVTQGLTERHLHQQ
jgi:hypothetical protein